MRLVPIAAVLAVAFALPAAADNTPQTLPFSQDWSNAALITTNDNWSSVPGVEGFLGQDIATTTGIDPQTLTGTSAQANDLDVIANQTTPNTNSSGGVAEFAVANPAVALQGSTTADAPHLLLHLDTRNRSGITVAYTLRDLDGSADNAVQPVALQYRVGNTGPFINVPGAFVADASTGPSLATLTTPVSATLPAAVDNQALVQVRVITANAAGNDEWIGIDDISVTATATTPSLSIDDIALDEGISGTTNAVFTISLSSPAGAGGVSFDVATADGSATAGSDYVALATTGVVIPAGQSSTTVNVTINGDTTVEANETYFVNVSNVVGANVGDGQGLGTIRNDDAAVSPDLGIADVSVLEGNAGTSIARFTVALATPAPAGGVTFDIATADGTASAGSDYVARSLAGQTIAAGASSFDFDVTINGESTFEPDETFSVTVTNVTGATVVDGSATGTIRNDDVALTPIHAVQGNGSQSPLVGTDVSVEGIVTARKSNGYFVQSADGEADADPATSQALFVFTSTTPPSDAAVGNRVRVFGRVTEFAFSDTTVRQLPLTQLASASGVTLATTLISTGNALPAPVDLQAADLAPGNGREAMERLEAMRVRAPALVSVAPSKANISEPNATSTPGNGVFFATLAGVPRPLREPGLDPDELVAQSAPASIPRFDNNAELLRIDSDGQAGAARVNVDAGTAIANLVGVVDYAFAYYSLLPDAGQLANDAGSGVLGTGRAPTAVAAGGSEEITIGGFNLLRFFDGVNDPAIGEPVLTAVALDKRLGHTAEAICRYVRLPDVLGVVEVENLDVLTQLADRINAYGAAGSNGCASNPRYVARLVEGNDVGGIDVGFLVSTREVRAGQPRVEIAEVVQLGKTTPFVNPDNSTELLNDRPPLLLRAVFHQANGASEPVSILINHLRSLGGVSDTAAGANGWPSAGARVRAKRGAQAQFVAQVVQDRQAADPAERIVLLGDFNVFEFNDGLVDGMGILTGRPAAAGQVLLPLASPLVTPLTVMTPLSPRDEQYSFSFDGNAQSLDHAVVNQAVLDRLKDVRTEHARINADFAETRFGTGPLRTSDHDPVVLYLRVPAFRDVDLGVDVTAVASGVAVGDTARFTIDASNNNAGASDGVRLDLVLDRALPGLVATAPAGWSCAAPVQGADRTTIRCTAATLAATATARITLDVPTSAGIGRVSLGLSASIAGSNRDTVAANDADAASVLVSSNSAPTFTGTPAISGTPRAGATLSVVDTATSDADGDSVTLAYQWLRDGTPIGSAAAATYVVADADRGTALSVRVTASDGFAQSVATTGTLAIPANRAPVAGSDDYRTPAGQALRIAAPGLLGNDSDADGDALVLDAATLARGRFATTGGSVLVAADGGFEYQPNPGFSGVDGFRYGITDALGAAGNEGVVRIEVEAPPPAFALRDDRFVLVENSPAVLLDVAANDLVDAARRAAGRLEIVQPPLRGTAAVDDAGTPGTAADDRLRYTANADTSGEDLLSYRLCEGGAGARCLEGVVQLVLRPIAESALELEVAGNGGFRDVPVERFRAMADGRQLVAGPVVALRDERPLDVDPSPESPWTGGGRQVLVATLPAQATAARWRVLVDAVSLSGGNVDVYAGPDLDNDGQPQRSETRCTSAMSATAERCELAIDVAANATTRYWVVLHNAGATAHTVRVQRAEVLLPADGTPDAANRPALSATGPAIAAARSNWPLRLGWSLPTLLDGQSVVGYVGLAADANGPVHWTPLRLTRRGGNAAPQPLVPGRPLAVTVPANGSVDRVFVDVPPGATSLAVTSTSGSALSLRLLRVPAPVEQPAPGTIAAADPDAEALEFDLDPGTRRATVNRPRAGRWYVVPVNASGQPVDVQLRVEVAGSAPRIRPGGFYNIGRSGHGLFLYPAAGDWAGVWYTYLQDGTSTWYYLQAAAPGSNGVWRSTLFRSRWNGSRNTLSAVGEAVITPTGPDAFTFTFQVDGETGSEAFSTFGRGCPQVGGRTVDASSHWFNPATSGSGYSVQFFPNYEFHAVFAYDGAGMPRFLIAERSLGGPDATLDLAQLSGFCPTCAYSGSPVRTRIGTLQRSIVDGALQRFVVDARFAGPLSGAWTANDPVQLLGGPGTTQGCAVP